MTDEDLKIIEEIYDDGVELEVDKRFHVTVEKEVYCFFDGDDVIGISKDVDFFDDKTMCKFYDMLEKNMVIISNPYIIRRDVVLFKYTEIQGDNSGTPNTTLVTRVGFNDCINLRAIKFKKVDKRDSRCLGSLPTLRYYHKNLYFNKNTIEEELKIRNINKLQNKI